jgi:hypothetical protein
MIADDFLSFLLNLTYVFPGTMEDKA